MTTKGGSHLELIEDVLVAVEDVIGALVLPIDRYHLRFPTFCGEDDVEQFTTEFS